MGWISLFKEFHCQAGEQEFPASVRALYTFFLGELNVRYDKTDELAYSERELSRLTGLKKTTLHDAIKFLSDRGFIKKSLAKNKTFFKILNHKASDHLPTSNRPPTDHLPTTFENSNYTCAKNFEDIKNIQTKNENDARAKSEELSEEIRHAWIQANGENPFGGYLADLLTRQKRYGAKAVAEAIERCRKKRTFGDLISINFLDSELLKGAEKSNGKIVPIRGNVVAVRKSEPEDWEQQLPDWACD